ncbi:MAG: hypothetical protein E5W91_26975 [Mesorhizobium sp.]|uniref:hypothetical protein n=1 Tax=Mesorhizobium sp. TaxID=1871066 RepID=UPI0011F5C821|nr:hypothetical protein [Mesorhizobium sp.]TIS54404.1 MAG: hypothetical protein E5W91_26975 [Mesorhizobium sp.]
MVSVRIPALAVTLSMTGWAATAGGAQASSLVVLGVSKTTPSVVRLGSAEPAGPSIMALGEELPDVTDETVAAIPDKPEPKHGFMQNPMIIRGGIVGGAFASPAPAAAPVKAIAAAAPAADGKPAATATASNSAPEPEPAAPQPTPIPAVAKPM